MIIYDPIEKKFEIKSSGRPFESGTQDLSRSYQWFLTFFGNASPQDIIAANSSEAQDLCHHLSHGDIQLMVCDYLNGYLSLNQFMILVGAVLRPSWGNLVFPPTLLRILMTWVVSTTQRINVVAQQYMNRPQNTATAANELVSSLNSAINNLRYAHRSTNRSVQGHFDMRVHRGLSIDPAQIAVLLYAWTQERPAFSGETSALLNDWEAHARSGIPQVATGIKMSEGEEVVTHTRKSHNPVMGSSTMPVRDQYLHGSFRCWTPISIDTCLFIFGCCLLAHCFGFYNFSWR